MSDEDIDVITSLKAMAAEAALSSCSYLLVQKLNSFGTTYIFYINFNT